MTDNDEDRSAESTVTEFSRTAAIPVVYCVEPRQNIALARNKAVSTADGEFIAFFDDDEAPAEDWLFRLYSSIHQLGCDGALGPVLPVFDPPPPEWVVKGGFFDRPNHPTGYRLSWVECRTGNVLFRREILSSVDEPFRAHFDAAGEDMDFFRRMIESGSTFAWCSDAPLYELIPASRCTRTFLLRRALLRGSNFPKHPADRAKNIVKSIAAVPAYAALLPLFAMFGQHVFLKYFIKLADHSARLLAFLGVPLARERSA